MTTNKTIVAFHIHRGGHFNNAGHYDYMSDIKNFQDLLGVCGDNEIFFNDTDPGTDKPLTAAEQTITDGSGRVLVEGADAINAEVGFLDFDGEYDSYDVCYIDNCSEREEAALLTAYKAGEVSKWDDRHDSIKEYLIDKGLIIDEEKFSNALCGDNGGAWIAESDDDMLRVADTWAKGYVTCYEPADGEDFDFACSQVDADPAKVKRIYGIAEDGSLDDTLFVALSEDVD